MQNVYAISKKYVIQLIIYKSYKSRWKRSQKKKLFNIMTVHFLNEILFVS